MTSRVKMPARPFVVPAAKWRRAVVRQVVNRKEVVVRAGPIRAKRKGRGLGTEVRRKIRRQRAPCSTPVDKCLIVRCSRADFAPGRHARADAKSARPRAKKAPGFPYKPIVQTLHGGHRRLLLVGACG